jgi:hypothetical protein
MKPFILLLLLIASGTLFATLTRPFTLFAEATQSLWSVPKQLKAKRLMASAAVPNRGRTDSPKSSLPGDRWQPATQF